MIMIAEQSVMAFKYVVLITSLNDGEETEAAYKTERRFLAGQKYRAGKEQRK